MLGVIGVGEKSAGGVERQGGMAGIGLQLGNRQSAGLVSAI